MYNEEADNKVDKKAHLEWLGLKTKNHERSDLSWQRSERGSWQS